MLNEFVFFLLLFKTCERRRKNNLYEVWRKQQMLKIRLMGTKSDIRWFQNFLQIDSDIEVLELMATQAAQQRMEKAIGKTIPKKQIKALVPPIKAKYPIMDWKNLPFNTAVWKESEKLAGKRRI